MPRRPTEPRYFASRNGYYVQVNGKQVCLAKGPEDDPSVRAEADKKFHELMLATHAETEGDKGSCFGILNAFLGWVKENRKPRTAEVYQRFCQAFVKDLGEVAVKDLRPYEVEKWLQKKSQPWYSEFHRRTYQWGQGSRRHMVLILGSAFNWAVRQGLISKNPVAKMIVPAGKARGGEVLVSEDMFAELMRVSNATFANLLLALYETGARPGEICQVEAKHYQPGERFFVLHEWKCDKTGKPRVIYITEKLEPVIKNLLTIYPEGPLFRNTWGKPWNDNTLMRQFERLRTKLGEKFKNVTAYSLRHTFATNWLKAGGSVAYLAQLMGTGIVQIQKHYGHLGVHQDAIRDALRKFKEGGEAPEEKDDAA